VKKKNKKISKNLPLGFAIYCLVLKLSAFELTRYLYAAIRMQITLTLGNKTDANPSGKFLEKCSARFYKPQFW
jgi:hypothetical protein